VTIDPGTAAVDGAGSGALGSRPVAPGATRHGQGSTRHGQGSTRHGPGLLARRPEVVPVGATVLAWAALTAESVGWWINGTGAAGHAGHEVFTPAGIVMVAAMTVAMMGPLSVPGVRTVAFTSLWWRAGRASLWFFAAFIATWTVIAACLATIASTLDGVLGTAATAAGVLVLFCALAELDPGRAVRMKSCDRPMRLRGNGFDADVDCLRFGLLSAGRGVRLCALPMLAMLALPGSLLLMALLTGLTVADRVTEGRRWLLLAALYAVLGVGLLWVGGR